MLFLANESLIFVIYLQFRIYWYIPCQSFFCEERFEFKDNGPKMPHFHQKNDVTLNITKIKNTP